MLAKIHSSIVVGVEGYPVEVEVDISSGLPVFSTVGLPDGAVRESKDRVKAAIRNSGYIFPNKRITVNLAPADVKKIGACYDLPIAIGILVAAENITSHAHQEYCVVGELSLDGSLRPVKGVLPMVLAARQSGMRGIIVPQKNVAEAAVVRGIEVIAVEYLYEAVEFLSRKRDMVPASVDMYAAFSSEKEYDVDFCEVKGQEHAKRALEITASGGHNILLKGPPGSGKTMLVRRLPTILPALTLEEAIETTKIHSISGLLEENQSLLSVRPFRAPHHTISDAGLIGGGSIPKPGEVSLANNGVLFLDELPEFKRHVLEVLRQPLEDGRVTIARASMSLGFPARFVLAAALNPCPCGFLGDRKNECNCNPMQIQRYMSRLSGPLLDRIDIHVEVSAISYAEMNKKQSGETSACIRERVDAVREVQKRRYEGCNGLHCNAQMGPREIEKFCALAPDSAGLLERSMEKLGLSARACHRILKIARTIADMDNQEGIQIQHVAEAVQYRRLNLS